MHLIKEYFLEDMVNFLIFMGHEAPQELTRIFLEEVVILFMALMGSTSYIKNPYLRTKLSEVNLNTLKLN